MDCELLEPLNSVLDNNKRMMLVSGETIMLDNAIRIVFVISHNKYWTPASVSRNGCVWIQGKFDR